MKRKTYLRPKAAPLTPLRDEPLLRPAGVKFVDIHCHCLPRLDDGPATVEAAVNLCRSLTWDGVSEVIATAHQLGRYEGRNDPNVIRQAVARLNDELDRQAVPLKVFPGADVRVDERLPRMLEDDRVLTLADGGRYVLLEMPHDVFIDISHLLEALASRNLIPIISHPERHPLIARRPELIRPWLDKDILLQITAASLAGDFGPPAQKAGWHFLTSGARTVIATDAHDLTERPPRMQTAYGLIREKLGAAAANRMCCDDPARILAGSDTSSTGKTGHREAYA